MALLIYSNGVTETYKPNSNVFNEKEIVEIFSNFSEIKTCRPIQCVNTWCVYGISADPVEYSSVMSEFLNTQIFSPVLIIHDSEIDPNWKATDDILYKNYNQFEKEVNEEIEISSQTVLTKIKESNKNPNRLPYLVPIGPTADKRLLLSYDPEQQHPDFYVEEFFKFAKKAYTYLMEFPQKSEPFTIYEDTKAIIIIPTEKVKAFLDSMITEYTNKEEYEICTNISNMLYDWFSIVTVINPTDSDTTE